MCLPPTTSLSYATDWTFKAREVCGGLCKISNWVVSKVVTQKGVRGRHQSAPCRHQSETKIYNSYGMLPLRLYATTTFGVFLNDFCIPSGGQDCHNSGERNERCTFLVSFTLPCPPWCAQRRSWTLETPRQYVRQPSSPVSRRVRKASDISGPVKIPASELYISFIPVRHCTARYHFPRFPRTVSDVPS